MMPRIRTVKPDLHRHIGLFRAEKASGLPLRLGFIALFSCCDRRGRFPWELKSLKISLVPFDDDIPVEDLLNALVIYGFVKKYEYQGEIYGCIPSWEDHQVIGNREKESRLPALKESRLLEVMHIQQRTVIPPLENFVQTENPVKNLENNAQSDCEQSVIPPEITEILDIPPEEKTTEESGSVVALTASETSKNKIKSVFNHWKTVMDHPNAMLDPNRQGLIKKALRFGYNVEQLCDAITGCSLTPHNMGDNERGQRYDGLHVILRDSDQIDRFSRNCHCPPRLVTEADRKTLANVKTLEQWAYQKMAEGAHGEA